MAQFLAETTDYTTLKTCHNFPSEWMTTNQRRIVVPIYANSANFTWIWNFKKLVNFVSEIQLWNVEFTKHVLG